ncbi:MAG: carboxypeptidase-like regulatory domain-containing protein [Chthoniobacteraceae bacterium]
MRFRILASAIAVLGIVAVIAYWIFSGLSHATGEKLSEYDGPYLGLKDPRWPSYMKRRNADPKLDWRTPISFYGKVVDENGNVVPGTEAKLMWNDLSWKGTSERKILSDKNGLFSVTGLRGKCMVVQVSKPGYYNQRSKNRAGFEYAGFWEPTFHRPDLNNPVTFYLRKKGERASLLFTEGEFLSQIGEAHQIPIPHRNGDAEDLPLRVELIDNDRQARRWRVRLTSKDGGFVPTYEEFSFLAPETGYKDEIILDQSSQKPVRWNASSNDDGGWLYFKTTRGYGLLEIQQQLGKKTMDFKIRFNPTGSRNLEP